MLKDRSHCNNVLVCFSFSFLPGNSVSEPFAMNHAQSRVIFLASILLLSPERHPSFPLGTPLQEYRVDHEALINHSDLCVGIHLVLGFCHLFTTVFGKNKYLKEYFFLIKRTQELK